MGCDVYLYVLFSGCVPDSVGKRMLPEINCFGGNLHHPWSWSSVSNKASGFSHLPREEVQVWDLSQMALSKRRLEKDDWRKEEGRNPVQNNIKGWAPLSWLTAWTEHGSVVNGQACKGLTGDFSSWSASLVISNTRCRGSGSLYHSLKALTWRCGITVIWLPGDLPWDSTWPEGTWYQSIAWNNSKKEGYLRGPVAVLVVLIAAEDGSKSLSTLKSQVPIRSWVSESQPRLVTWPSKMCRDLHSLSLSLAVCACPTHTWYPGELAVELQPQRSLSQGGKYRRRSQINARIDARVGRGKV